MDNPLVSVIMPVYHVSTDYIDQAIFSILQQSYKNFELIIVNENPDKNFRLSLQTYHDMDPRIRVFHVQNLGLASSLNFGIQNSNGKYFARMDGDDIAESERLEKEVEFLEAHPDIAITGSWISLINERGQFLTRIRLPTLPIAVRFHFYFHNCIAHPTIMCRKEAARDVGYYSDEYTNCEDVDLWIRLLQNKVQIANLPLYLLRYRTHESSVSTQHQELQLQNEVQIIHDFIERDLGFVPDRNTIQIVIKSQQLKNFKRIPLNIENIKELEMFIFSVYTKFTVQHQLNEKEKRAVNRILSTILFNVSILSLKVSWKSCLTLFFKAANLNHFLLFDVTVQYMEKFLEFLRTGYYAIQSKILR